MEESDSFDADEEEISNMKHAQTASNRNTKLKHPVQVGDKLKPTVTWNFD